MTDPENVLREGDALLVVDVQNDFCPGGALPVHDGDAVVPVLNRWLDAAGWKGVPVYASRDWHPVGHVSFATRGGRWPEHCLQGTGGAGFHPRLELPRDAVIVSKGVRLDRDQYSAFDETGLAERLRSDGIRRLWIGGLALDVCVEATALDGCAAGFKVYLIADATRPISPEGGDQALTRLREAGATIETWTG